MEELANLELANSTIGARAYGNAEAGIADILSNLKSDNEIEAYGQTGNTTITGITFGQAVEQNGIELEIGATNAVVKAATFTSSDPSQDYWVQIRGKKHPIGKINGVIKITKAEVTTGTETTGEIREVSSNREEYVTVEKVSETTDKIKITGVAKGEATITVKYTNEIYTTIAVRVKGNVTVSTQVVNVSDNAEVGTATEITNASYAEGSEISLTAAVKDNYSNDYEFVGWYETKDSGTETQKSTNASYTYTVPNDGTEEVVLKAKFEEKSNPIAGKTTPTNNRTLSGSTDTSKMTYKNPVIPQGFIALDTTGATWSYTNETTLDEVSGWNNGLVIKDSTNNNEFVWVPCTTESVTSSSPIVQYARDTNYPMYSGMSNIANASDTKSNTGDGKTYSAIPVTTENAQIATYGGFYVARYEAGLASGSNSTSINNYNNVPVSIAGTKVWNYVDYEHSYVAAQKMVSGTTYGNNKSGLITGIQWDTIMKWFEKSSIGVTGTTQDWGTYKDVAYSGNGSYFTYGSSVGTWTSGSFSHSKYSSSQSINSSYPAHYHASGLNTTKGYQKNIADLGGNLWEWTSEQCTYSSSSGRVCRGGGAGGGAAGYPASYRDYFSPTNSGYGIGFRVVLYIQ